MGRGKVKTIRIITAFLVLLFIISDSVYSSWPKEHRSLMYSLIKDGNYNEIRYYLDVCPQDVNSIDYFFYDTPLHYAVQRGDPRIIELLISRGANLNTQDNDGIAPLQKALEDNKLKAVEILIRHGADVNLRNSKGQTPIFHSVLMGDFNTVKILVKAGADVNIIDDQGKPLIKYAFDRGNRKIIKLLISKGADPEYTQIFDCLKKGDFDMISYMAVKSPGFFKLAIIPFLLPILLILTILIIRRIRSI